MDRNKNVSKRFTMLLLQTLNSKYRQYNDTNIEWLIILVQISLFFSKISIIEQNICQIFFFFSKIFYKIGFPKHILTKFTDITCKHKTRSFTFILTQEKASTCTILYLNCILNNKYNWNTSTTQTYQVRKPHKETCKHCRLCWLAELDLLPCIFVAVWFCGDLTKEKLSHTSTHPLHRCHILFVRIQWNTTSEKFSLNSKKKKKKKRNNILKKFNKNDSVIPDL